MENKKKLPLPILVIIISLLIGVVIAGIGLIKQADAKKTNEERYQAAYEQALANKERLEKRYEEIVEALKPLKSQYEAKSQERDALSMSDPDWFAKNSKYMREIAEIQSQISDLELEQFQIEHYDNTVYYTKVEPMSYQIFYIIGASVFGLGLIGAFIIYLVKGKKSY